MKQGFASSKQSFKAQMGGGVGYFISILIMIVVAVAVTIPVTNGIIISANLTGVTATVVGVIPALVAVLIIVFMFQGQGQGA